MLLLANTWHLDSYVNTMSPYSDLSLILFKNILFALFLMHFSCVFIQSYGCVHWFVCLSYILDIASFTSSYHQHVSPMHLPHLFFQHTSSNAQKTTAQTGRPMQTRIPCKIVNRITKLHLFNAICIAYNWFFSLETHTYFICHLHTSTFVISC